MPCKPYYNTWKWQQTDFTQFQILSISKRRTPFTSQNIFKVLAQSLLVRTNYYVITEKGKRYGQPQCGLHSKTSRTHTHVLCLMTRNMISINLVLYYRRCNIQFENLWEQFSQISNAIFVHLFTINSSCLIS